jgi:short-subunit dehydrogenase
MATYCATKHAIIGVTEAVREEIRGSGVGLTLVLPSFTNTELTAGTTKPRFVDMPEAQDVADAIIDAVRRGKPEVYVPRTAGPLVWLMNILPRRLREAISRAIGAHDMFKDIDHQARKAYEDRAATSAPGRSAVRR